MVYFKENYNILRFQRGSNVFNRGGPTFSRGSKGPFSMKKPIEPYPSSGSTHDYYIQR